MTLTQALTLSRFLAFRRSRGRLTTRAAQRTTCRPARERPTYRPATALSTRA
jgi:hypothetical protein